MICASCASCVSRVERALQGVLSASVNLATEKAAVQALRGVNVAGLLAAVQRAGYAAQGLDVGQAAAPTVGPPFWPVSDSTASLAATGKPCPNDHAECAADYQRGGFPHRRKSRSQPSFLRD